MNPGYFSVSLTVKDLGKSKVFYENLGFKVYAGQESAHFLIMKNSETNIGLFQDMFDKKYTDFQPWLESEC